MAAGFRLLMKTDTLTLHTTTRNIFVHVSPNNNRLNSVVSHFIGYVCRMTSNSRVSIISLVFFFSNK